MSRPVPPRDRSGNQDLYLERTRAPPRTPADSLRRRLDPRGAVVSKPKQIRLAINLLASGRHNASWKTLPDPAGLSTDIDVFIRIARTAERGLLDGIFLADNYAGPGRGVVQAAVPGAVARRAAGRAGHPHQQHRPRPDRPGAVRRPGHARPRDRQPGPRQQGPGRLEHHHQPARALAADPRRRRRAGPVGQVRQGRRVRDRGDPAVGLAAARGDRGRRGHLHLRRRGAAAAGRVPGRLLPRGRRARRRRRLPGPAAGAAAGGRVRVEQAVRLQVGRRAVHQPLGEAVGAGVLHRRQAVRGAEVAARPGRAAGRARRLPRPRRDRGRGPAAQGRPRRPARPGVPEGLAGGAARRRRRPTWT